MSVIPTGNPAWVRSNAHTAYGGNVNKVNYQSVGTVNPRTDLSAENLCRMAADLAAVARTAPFATMTFQCQDSAPSDPDIEKYYSMAGGQPTGTRNGVGEVLFTWSPSYTDDYGVSGNVNIIGAIATAHATAPGAIFATVQLGDTNADGRNDTVYVYVYDFAANPVVDARVTLTVWTG